MTKEKSLVQKLKRNKEGKPILDLKPLDNTAVSVPTKKQYDELMRVYECGDWKWRSNDNPTKSNCWDIYAKETCIEAGKDFLHGSTKIFGFGRRIFYKDESYKIISPQEFYDIQEPPITPDMIEEINDWFNKQNE